MTRISALFVARALGLLIMGGLLSATHARAQAPVDGCVTCHAALSQSELSSPVTAFRTDVHNDRGFRCADCHGGDPTTEDKARAKDPARGYRGKPTGTQIVTTCARCHSDAGVMRKFAPAQRIDQAAEYATSVHGISLAGGDQKVATCVSCHHAHGVRGVKDARAPVFPTNVAALCASCHSNAEHMKGYTSSAGAPLPINQRDDYDKSVHSAALTKQNDLSAPTCNDCHGNHGAMPPGVGAVSNVCGTCHAVFAAKFATSAHSQIFDSACVACHGNHAVLTTSDDMIGTSKETLCWTCHTEPDDAGFVAAGRMRASIEKLKTSLAANGGLIARARNAGMEVATEELALSEARTKLVLARTEIHAFDPASLDSVVAEGTKILSGVEQGGNRALSELAYRRRGLFVSLAAILLFVVALGLKVRSLRKER
jgi:predicted CXXCH cytochrome family protein